MVPPSNKSHNTGISHPPHHHDDIVGTGDNDNTLHMEEYAEEARCVYTSPRVFGVSGVMTPITRVAFQLPTLMKLEWAQVWLDGTSAVERPV